MNECDENSPSVWALQHIVCEILLEGVGQICSKIVTVFSELGPIPNVDASVTCNLSYNKMDVESARVIGLGGAVWWVSAMRRLMRPSSRNR